MNLLSNTFVLGLSEGGFSMKEIFASATIFNKGLMIFLALLLFYQIYYVIERLVMYRQSGSASETFLKTFMTTLRNADFEASKRAATTHQKSHIAMVLKHGLDHFQYEKTLQVTNPNHDVIQPVERAIERGSAEVTEMLKRGMATLATIASLSPFIAGR